MKYKIQVDKGSEFEKPTFRALALPSLALQEEGRELVQRGREAFLNFVFRGEHFMDGIVKGGRERKFMEIYINKIASSLVQ